MPIADRQIPPAHLNLPGAPNGAFLDQGALLAAVVTGRCVLPPEPGVRYCAFVDMGGGSSDDAVLSIAHKEGRRAVIDLVVKQDGAPPFNPRNAVRKFAGIMREYGIDEVVGAFSPDLSNEWRSPLPPTDDVMLGAPCPFRIYGGHLPRPHVV